MYKIIKRITDFILALLLLILLSPVFLIIIFILKINHIPRTIFRQLRTGLEGKPFIIYKFTTILNDETPKFCSILRKTGLDELPQLFNILKGDMSFIGPRPWIDDYYKLFTKKQKERLKVLPGITGYAQVNKCSDVKDRIKKDIYYVNNYSFLLDINILFKTFKMIGNKTDFSEEDIKRDLEILKSKKK